MKKNDLIKILQNLKGNPEIVLWNGMVQDYMHIDPDIQEDFLFKYTWEGMQEACRLDRCRDLRDMSFQFTEEETKELRECYLRHHKWEFNRYMTEEDCGPGGWHKKKKVLIIQPKLRGETSFDRIASISY